MTTLTIVVFAVFAALGMPLSFALGFASVAILYVADFELVMMSQRMLYAVDNFPLMAIPLFILAGEIMVKVGMMERLVAFANSLIGSVHGGLAHVTIIVGTILAAGERCRGRLARARSGARWCPRCASTTRTATPAQ